MKWSGRGTLSSDDISEFGYVTEERENCKGLVANIGKPREPTHALSHGALIPVISPTICMVQG